MSKVINLEDYRKNKIDRYSKDIEPIECENYEEFILVLKTYFDEDSEEFKRLLECFEDTKKRLTIFYKDVISSVINDSHVLSSLSEETDSEGMSFEDSDMASDVICEKEACSIVLEILWNLNKEE